MADKFILGFPISEKTALSELYQDGSNIGIGTDEPDLMLHLSHSDSNNGLLLQNTNNVNNYQILQNIRENEGLIWQRWIDGTFNANLMTIDYSGNLTLPNGSLGIGMSTSPISKLTLEGERNTNTITLRTTNNDSGWTIGDEFGAIEFYSNDSSGGSAGVMSAISCSTATTSGSTSELSFSTSEFGSRNVERMRIDSSGNVGIGTESPDTLIHLHQADATSSLAKFTNSSTGQGSSDGLIVGYSSGGYALFHNYEDTDIRFATNNDTKVTIDNDGNVLINKTTYQNAGAGVIIRSDDSSGGNIRLTREDNTDTQNNIVFFSNSGSVIGKISTTTSATAYNTSSDYRLKTDFKDFSGTEMLSNIKMYDFAWKESGERTYGVMAHELQEVLPQAVTGEKDGEEMQAVDYSKIVPVLVKALQEANERIEVLENKLNK